VNRQNAALHWFREQVPQVTPKARRELQQLAVTMASTGAGAAAFDYGTGLFAPAR